MDRTLLITKAGKLKKLAACVDSVGNHKYGAHARYYENGQLRDSMVCVNGKVDGQFVHYYENGQMQAIGYYTNHPKKGHYYVSYHENGQVGQTKRLRNGQSSIREKIYYESSALQCKAMIDKNGYKKTVHYYFESGQTSQIERYKKGGHHCGKWKYYYENGQLKGVEYFKKGLYFRSIEHASDGTKTILE